MPLTSADILFRKAKTVSDAATNGGIISANLIGSAVKNAVFPDVRQAERQAGSVTYRKVFVHFAPPDGSLALDVKVIPFLPTPAQDRVLVLRGTQTDTQQDMLLASPRPYGIATYTGTVAAGANSLTVTQEAIADALFAVGDTVFVTDKDAINAATGSEEYATLSNVAYGASSVTLTFATALQNAYTNPRVCSVIEAGDVLAQATDAVVTSVAGTFDATAVQAHPARVGYHEYTLNFVTGTQFNVLRDSLPLSTGHAITDMLLRYLMICAWWRAMPRQEGEIPYWSCGYGGQIFRGLIITTESIC